jgi:hypothetical protein
MMSRSFAGNLAIGAAISLFFTAMVAVPIWLWAPQGRAKKPSPAPADSFALEVRGVCEELAKASYERGKFEGEHACLDAFKAHLKEDVRRLRGTTGEGGAP